jgi:hypothetical protein
MKQDVRCPHRNTSLALGDIHYDSPFLCGHCGAELIVAPCFLWLLYALMIPLTFEPETRGDIRSGEHVESNPNGDGFESRRSGSSSAPNDCAAWLAIAPRVIRGRVVAGMEYARHHGTKIGITIGCPRRIFDRDKVARLRVAGDRLVDRDEQPTRLRI